MSAKILASVKSLVTFVTTAIPWNFITLHYFYYIALCMLSGLIFWGSSTPAQSVSFTDSLFLTVSAMSQAGLNTVNLSELNTWQQILLFLLILAGSPIIISTAVVHTRKVAFERRFTSVIEEQRRRRQNMKGNISRPILRTFSRSKTIPNDLQSPVVDGVVVRGRRIPPRSETTRTNDTDRVGENSRPERLRSPNHTEQKTTQANEKEPAGDNPILEPAVNSNPTEQGPAQAKEKGRASEDVIPDRADSRDRAENEPNGDVKSDLTAHDIPENSSQIPSLSRKRTQHAPEHVKFSEPEHFRDSPALGLVRSPDAISRATRSLHLRSPRTPHSEGFRITAETRDEFRSTSKYFDSDGLIGRNSQFHSLSLDERERLGGVEYRAVVLLEWIVILYYILWQLLGCLGLGAWMAYHANDVTLQNGLNPWWVGAFLAVSAFNNNGMSLLDANMVPFQSSVYVLLTSGLLILAGNTCYPIFLRLILWTLLKVLPEDEPYFEEYRQTLRFLLDHPRRCYTTLFQSYHTWWLLASLFMLNGIDWIAFEILNIGNTSIFTTSSPSWGLDGLFQALAVRSGGFYVVPIANLRIGLLVLYVLMMYISVYPVTITLRNSNVYEERSLGIYADDPEVEMEKAKTNPFTWLSKMRHRTKEGSRSYFVRQQLRGQLAHDLWWICVAVLFIVIIETPQYGPDPVTFSVFNIIFETVSAYGTVGISTGAPNVAFSFCGLWHVLSKLILCAVMIRGRHRGLPVAIDRAVLLPGEKLGHAEEEDASLRREITIERMNTRVRRATSHLD